MDSYVIETANVSRSFGNSLAVDDLTLRVRRGSIYGFLGRNGAGKTTTLKMLVGLIWPDRGAIKVNGVEPSQFTVEDRWKIGYVSERQVLNPFMRVDALIRFTSSFYPTWDFAACDRLLKQFGIDPTKRVRALSLGMTRQVAFMLAVAQRPDLLILDEPAANLDVVTRREFLNEVLDLLREEGKTVLISSHILSDVERVADEIGIIAQGKLRISEPLDRLKETVKKVRFFGFQRSGNHVEIPDALHFSRTGNEVVATMRVADESQVAKVAAANRCQYEVIHLNLEDIFVEMVREPKEQP
jgi:ABC-2 type transport system ATP-binding protein